MLILIPLIISCRKHYTIDIVIALYISYFMYLLFIFRCNEFGDSWMPNSWRKKEKQVE